MLVTVFGFLAAAAAQKLGDAERLGGALEAGDDCSTIGREVRGAFVLGNGTVSSVLIPAANLSGRYAYLGGRTCVLCCNVTIANVTTWLTIRNVEGNLSG